jgi:hypothetical protein
MDHWFDTLTRNLNRQPLTRRTMLSWTSKLGVAAGVGLLGRTTTTVGAAPVAAPEAAPALAPAFAPSACTVEDSYGVLKTIVTASSGDPATPLTLSHTFIAEAGSGSAFSTLTITPGQVTPVKREDLVLRFTSSTLANKRGHASTSFGRRYTGGDVRGGAFNTDGRTVQGNVDGRETVEAPLGTDHRGFRFKDGQASRPLAEGAQATQSQAVQQAVSALLTQSRSLLATCAPDSKASREVSTCTSCQLTCRQTWVQCSLAATQASLAAGALAPGAYLGAASATCDGALQSCVQTCKSSGACCPDYCKGNTECCQSAWGCCPPSSASVKPWSKAWPTCPRCGTPPWPAAAKPGAPRTTTVRPGPRR